MKIKGHEIDVVKSALFLVALLAATSALWNWYHPKEPVNTVSYQAVTQEKIVEKIKRVVVPGPERIVTIEKQVIVEKLGIAPLKEGTEVIANAFIPPSEGGSSVVALMDMKTGEGSIIAKEKEQSLFGFPSDVEAMARYGVTTRGGQGAELAARWQFLRVGRFKLGAYGELSSQPEAKAMLEVAYRF